MGSEMCIRDSAIAGAKRSDVLAARPGTWSGAINNINAGSWRGMSRQTVNASAYVAHTLEAALWSVGRTADFRSAVLHAANLGQDADTTAAIAGQLAGALTGADDLPRKWRAQTAWAPRIASMAEALAK